MNIKKASSSKEEVDMKGSLQSTLYCALGNRRICSPIILTLIIPIGIFYIIITDRYHFNSLPQQQQQQQNS